jgi:hypothetical protein
MASATASIEALKTVAFEDLTRTLGAMIASGRVGQPVNVRIHWQFEPGVLSLETAAARSAALADAVLELANPHWTIRRSQSADTDAALLNVLCLDDRGRTLLIALATTDSPEFSLTVYGNHGVATLKAATLTSGPDNSPAWLSSLERSIQTG